MEEYTLFRIYVYYCFVQMFLYENIEFEESRFRSLFGTRGIAGQEKVGYKRKAKRRFDY